MGLMLSSLSESGRSGHGDGGHGPGDRRRRALLLTILDGKVYKAELWVEDGKLKARGYFGFFYKTQTWVKGA